MANDIYKNIKSRYKLKNGTKSEWDLTNIFIPLKGEPIIYNPDETHLNYRYKIGDGVTDVKELPFADNIQLPIEKGNGENSIVGNDLENNKAYGNYSTAIGYNTETAAEKQLVCGTWNTLDNNSAFIVGNGSSATNRNYALNVHNNGKAYLGSADIDETNDKSIVTKKYVDNKIYNWKDIKDAPDISTDSNYKTTISGHNVSIYSIDTLDLNSSVIANIYANGEVNIGSSNININSHESTTIESPYGTVAVKNLVDPIKDTDAANKKYVDSKVKSIEVTGVDLTGYATEKYVNKLLSIPKTNTYEFNDVSVTTIIKEIQAIPNGKEIGFKLNHTLKPNAKYVLKFDSVFTIGPLSGRNDILHIATKYHDNVIASYDHYLHDIDIDNYTYFSIAFETNDSEEWSNTPVYLYWECPPTEYDTELTVNITLNETVYEFAGINNSHISKSITETSLIGNDLENNKAYGNYSTAMGYNTSAGSNAFKIVDVDIADDGTKIITLSSVTGIKNVLASEKTLQYSCQFTENFDLCGSITDVDETACAIIVDKLPNTSVTTGTLWIPSHPELGDGETIVGTGAVSIGYSNKSSQIGTFTTGYNNIAAGKYSIVSGSSNTAGFASAVFGQYNNGHQWSLVGGYKNTVTAPFAFAAGYNNIVSKQYASTLGYGNTVDGEASFVAGTGSTVKSINSLASGVDNIIEAIAKESLAVGSNNIIKAPYSAAIGFKHTINASANGRAFAAGSSNTVSHNFSAAIGHALTTSRDSQIVVGRQNINDSTAMFIVGNGTAADKLNNAFVVKETGDAVVSGALKAKTATISGDLYANAYTGTSGKVVINSSTNTATGDSSFSGGNASQALGRFSFAFGKGSIAGTTNDNGKYAVAIGFDAKATHDGAVAIGWGIKAPYKYSTALGINTETAAENQLVCGTWNTLDTNSAFIIGNGTSDSARSYAFNVRKNGQALLGSADILEDDKAVATKKYVDTRIIVGDGVPSSDLDCLLYIRRN